MTCFICRENGARICSGGDCGLCAVCAGSSCPKGAAHTEQDARSVAFIKNEKGGRWSAVNCGDCEWWHVMEKE